MTTAIAVYSMLSRKSLSSKDYRLYIFINKIPTLGSKLVFREGGCFSGLVSC